LDSISPQIHGAGFAFSGIRTQANLTQIAAELPGDDVPTGNAIRVRRDKNLVIPNFGHVALWGAIGILPDPAEVPQFLP